MLCREILPIKISSHTITFHVLDHGYCLDPDNFPGVCKHIKECPIILNELMAKNNDAAFVQYLRDSNLACRNMDTNMPLVCCPPDGRKYQIPESSVQGRLLTPSEGCGFSNQELRLKLAVGHQSRLGDLHEILI